MTTGASNDLQRATKIARQMVTKFGMSPLGPVIFGDQNEEVFLGRDFGHVRNYSEDIAAKIDNEVNVLIDQAYERAKEILKKHKKLVENVANRLIEKETLNGKDFATFFKDVKVPKKISYSGRFK